MLYMLVNISFIAKHIKTIISMLNKKPNKPNAFAILFLEKWHKNLKISMLNVRLIR